MERLCERSMCAWRLQWYRCTWNSGLAWYPLADKHLESPDYPVLGCIEMMNAGPHPHLHYGTEL